MTQSFTNLALQTLVERARRFAQSGAHAEAASLYQQVLAQAPNHAESLGYLGAQALGSGRADQSLVYLSRALEHDPENAMLWKNLGLAQIARRAFDEALLSFNRALDLHATFPAALLNKGAVLEQLGRHDEAIVAYLYALGQVDAAHLGAGDGRLPPRMSALLERATELTEAAYKRWILDALAPLREEYGNASLSRVDRCLESHFSSLKQRPPDSWQKPTFMYFPGIPSRGWFDREDLPWLKKTEAQSADILRELKTVLGQGDEGFRPFVKMPMDHPDATYWGQVNQSPNWNAFFFYRDGERNDENCRRCPITSAALDSMPISRVAEHSPEALFSVLKPGVHIPPHTGVTNVRLVTHLPLIIPPNCGLRVGAQTRSWNMGECLIFDDTYEHEAWNQSDTTRVVLIFDIWNPYLTEIEQQAMRTVIEGFSNFRHAHGD